MIRDKSSEKAYVGLLNAQSVSQKSIAIADTISNRHLDVLVLTETWRHASADLSLRRCAPPGYSIVDASRQQALASTAETRGGGISVICNNKYTVKKLTFDVKPTTFDVLGFSLRSGSTTVVYVAIYRQGSAAVSDVFFNELTQ